MYLFPQALFALECKNYWKEHSIQEYLYNAETHSHITDRGNEGYETFYTPLQRDQCEKEWTVFIYMNADNDLTLSSYADIHEMEEIGSSVSVDILVYHDSNDETGSRYLHIAKNSFGKKRVRPNDFLGFSDREIFSPIAFWLPEKDSDDMGVFEDFIRWGLKKYPSAHTAIILWGHGMGWKSETIPQLKNSLEKLRQPSQKRFDILGMDACLMMMAEVAYELKNQARFLIGSASSEGTMGWPYTTILRHIVRSPYGKEKNNILGEGIDSAYQWAKAIPTLYAQSYSGSPFSSQEKDTKALMVSIHAEDLGTTLAESLNDVGRELIYYMNEGDPATQRQRFHEVQSILKKIFVFSGVSQDLYHFTVLINNILAMHRRNHFSDSQSAKKLQIAIDHLQNIIANHMVIGRGTSPHYFEVMSLGVTKGISIWLPPSNEEFKIFSTGFESSQLYHDAPEWKKFNKYIHSKEPFDDIQRIR